VSPRIKYLRSKVAEGLEWLMTDGPIANTPVFVETPKLLDGPGRGPGLSPWTYVDQMPKGRKFAIWRQIGDVYEVGNDGAVGDYPIWSPE
jgi:hypothetical protein